MLGLAALFLPLPANSIERQSSPLSGLSVAKACDSRHWGSRYSRCPDWLILIQAPNLQAPNLSDEPADIGQWRLVRTPGPQGDPEIVSIMHTADALQSDPDFAGLMIRCREKPHLQIGLVVIRPFPPRAQPQVTVTSDHSTTRLQATVLPGGIILTLPNEAEVLAQGSWQSLNQVSFAIEGDGITINGIVPLERLSAALAFLQSNCPEQ